MQLEVPLLERTGVLQRDGHLCKGAAVVRLHGPDRDGTEKLTGGQWDRIVAPLTIERLRARGLFDGM